MKTLLVVPFLSLATAAGALELAEAESLAVAADPALRALEARAEARRYDAVADGSLPDPRLALGTINAPLPGLDLGDEPMAQLQLAFEQQVPPRSLRRARADRSRAAARVRALEAAVRALAVRASVRRSWAGAVRLQALIALTEERRAVLDRYTAALAAGLQNGRVSQQALLEGRSRAIRVERQLARLRSRLAAERASLAERLPETTLPDSLADAALPEPAGPSLEDHPLLRAALAETVESDAAVTAARAAFDPGWSWQLGIGRRIGDRPLGAEADTLLHARIAVDLPLFTERRQGPRLAAARARREAAGATPVALRRALQARWTSAREQAGELAAVDTLYGTEILPPSRAAAAAARDRYRNGQLPLEDLLAAELEVLDVRHERLEALLELDLARVELAYLGGL